MARRYGMTAAAKGVVTGESLVDYDRRRVKLNSEFKAMGHGSRWRCSLDTRIPASLISNVLIGRWIDVDVIGKLERWIEVRREERKGIERFGAFPAAYAPTIRRIERANVGVPTIAVKGRDVNNDQRPGEGGKDDPV